MERCVANYRKTTGIELRMAIDPENFLSNELYVWLSVCFAIRVTEAKLKQNSVISVIQFYFRCSHLKRN